MKRLLCSMSLVWIAFVIVWVFTPASKSKSVFAAPPLPPGTTFDLRAFGAVGDGVTNDSPALQSALNAIANAGGGTLFVPAGRYAIVTPVSKDFSGLGASVTIRGVASSTVINTKGSGEQLTHGLDLTSEFVIRLSDPGAQAITLTGPNSLLITDMVFIGRQEVNVDARIPLVLVGIPNATIRHCEFYGLATLYEGGAIVYAYNSGLTIDQTAFLGCTGNSGTRDSVVFVMNWRKLTVTETVFTDYGQRPNYYGKLGLAPPFSWIMIGDAASLDSLTTRTDATIRNVFLDEGGWIGITNIPDYYNAQSRTCDLIYVSDLRINVSNMGTGALYIDRAQHVLIERGSFEYSHIADNSVNLLNVGDAILDRLSCVPAVNRIRANAGVGKLTVINSTCTNIESQAQTTTVLTTAPEDDPVQFVRHQYLAVLGTEPDGAGHYNWSNLLLLCGTNQACIAQRRAELASFLGTPAAPSFLRVNGVYLDWQDNSFSETGFKVERADTFNGPWTEIATTGTNANWFKIGSAGLSYFYRVRAFNSGGDSAYSNVACSSCLYPDSAPGPIFSDNFDDNSLDFTKWTINNAGTPTVREQSQQLQITFLPNTAGYNGIMSNSTYDLTSRMVQVEVVQPVSQAGWCENYLQVVLDANNYYLIDAGAGSMVLRSMVAGANNQTVLAYDPTAYHYWRIRHDQNANTINFETSPDGVAWTTQKTVATAFSLTGLKFYLMAGAWGTGNGNPGIVKYDNFRLVAGTTGTDSRIPNYGFESPVVGYSGFQYGPTGGSWSFVGGAGVTGNGSGFTGGLAIAPEGSQAAFLQGGNTSVISQSVSGFQANRTYIITFAAAQRSNCCNAGGQDFQVFLDNSLLGTFHPASGPYAYYGTPTFTTTAGSHTVKFVGLNSLGGDHSAFIDNVRLTISTGW